MSKVIIGFALDSNHTLSLAELSQACSMHAEWILELVDEGILEPIGSDMPQWRFSGYNLHRALVVRRLQTDLNVNLSGAALALELMDEIETLRARLNAQSCRKKI